jgi:ADP-heptose:LPS heptosyltransferase
VLKDSKRFEGYEIDLLGNEKWKDLALHFDSEYISNFTFIDPDSLYEAPHAVYEIGRALYQRKYEVVLQSTYSRSLMGNGLSGLASGREIIAYKSENELHPRYKMKTDKLYTRLIDPPSSIFHETEFNHYFFEQVIGRTLPFVAPNITKTSDRTSGIIIFTGSSNPRRNWEKEKFLALVRLILGQTNEPIFLAGGPSEAEVSQYISDNSSSDRVFNKTGATSLPDFVNLIAGSKLVISNETSSVHIAAACKVPVVCILGGGHFARFVPYPDVFGSRLLSVYKEMPCYNCNWICEFKNENEEAFPCISGISVEQVWTKVLPFLQDNFNPDT